ncbi:unnamed protein product [Tetraodon nigroviridis]|uniref:Nucleophosmin n=1 Tax=Tetraodon nigroviridis TaxID=99883 RepID=Q4S3W0_TETNG|nr:unnamed protein product [Tetraodon nigroviridis]
MEDDFSDLSRPQIYLFGCTLKSDKREFKIDADDDDTEQQLSLKAMCVGPEAEDKFHMVEIEGLTYDGKSTKVPLAALKPSIMPSMSLGGFEIMPPVTFRLQAGSGPVHISGQHFVRVKDAQEEEENNTSPVKRPLSLSVKKPTSKKLKMDSDDDDDDEEDSDEEDNEDDDEDDESDEDVKPQKKELKKIPDFSAKKTSKTPVKENGPTEKSSGLPSKPQTKTPAAEKDKAQAGPSKSPSLPEIKNKLSTAAKEGKPLPKTEQKFENFVKSSFKITDKKVVKDLWTFVQSLKIEKKCQADSENSSSVHLENDPRKVSESPAGNRTELRDLRSGGFGSRKSDQICRSKVTRKQQVSKSWKVDMDNLIRTSCFWVFFFSFFIFLVMSSDC